MGMFSKPTGGNKGKQLKQERSQTYFTMCSLGSCYDYIGLFPCLFSEIHLVNARIV